MWTMMVDMRKMTVEDNLREVVVEDSLLEAIVAGSLEEDSLLEVVDRSMVVANSDEEYDSMQDELHLIFIEEEENRFRKVDVC